MCFFRKKKKVNEVKEVKTETSTVEKEEPVKVEPKQEPTPVKKVNEKPKQVEPKKVEPKPKEEVKPEVEESVKFAYHITQVKDEKSEFYKMWRVRRSGSNKVIKHFKTQKEAIEEAKKYAEGNEDASIVIHKVDGKIRKQKY